MVNLPAKYDSSTTQIPLSVQNDSKVEIRSADCALQTLRQFTHSTHAHSNLATFRMKETQERWMADDS